MKQLLEDYRNRLINATDSLNTTSNTGSENHIKKIERLKTKCSCYRSLIAELEKEKVALKAPEMLEDLKGIYRLRNIIIPPAADVKPEHQDEVTAIYQAIKKIESLLKELE